MKHGVIVLVERDGALLIENVAVDPDRQMSENLAIYAHCGYVETERRAQGGFARVFLDKRLGPADSG